MNRSRTFSLLLFALLLSLTVQARQRVQTAPVCTSDVEDKYELKSCCNASPCLQTVRFKSKLVNAALPYRVIVPAYYATAEAERQRYPVIYLLHGLGGHYDNWATKTKLIEYARAYKFIIVMPEGNDGWYTDSATVAADKYETYFLQELLPDVQSRYRTVESREARAVAGLSMGGYGALKFGLKYPEKFAVAASISGALDAAQRTDDDPRYAWNFLRASILQTFGAAGSATRAANDVYKLARETPAARLAALPFFYLDCGTADGFLPTSRELANIFLERKIAHEYRQLPGEHNWAYWDAQVREVLRVAAQKIPQARLANAAQAGLSPRSQLRLRLATKRTPAYAHCTNFNRGVSVA